MTYTNQQSGTYSATPAAGQPTYSEAWALVAAARKLIESTQITDDKERKKAMQAGNKHRRAVSTMRVGINL